MIKNHGDILFPTEEHSLSIVLAACYCSVIYTRSYREYIVRFTS